MLKIKKRHMKKIAIVITPIAILCVISYASITSLSKASESAFAYEHYYEDEAYSDGQKEYDNNKDSGNLEDDSMVEFDDTIIAITNHDSVVLDTNPDSITVLVNKELSLPTEYIPKDLVVPNVLFSIDYFDEKKQMRAEAAKALEELFHASEGEDLSLCAISGYRSYQRQYDIFTANIRKQGLKHTVQYSAMPSYSEHQTGLSIDVSTKLVNNRLDSPFAETPEGKWLAENAYLFGYIIRYPEDKTEITGYSYEPWHIRYVGKALSRYLYENNLALEEYYSFESTIDYANEISYDNLEDFGIDLDDVIVKPVVKVPEVIPEEVPEEIIEDELEEDPDAIEEEAGTEDDTDVDPEEDPEEDTDAEAPEVEEDDTIIEDEEDVIDSEEDIDPDLEDDTEEDDTSNEDSDQATPTEPAEEGKPTEMPTSTQSKPSVPVKGAKTVVQSITAK